ncbi:hypothetical protein ACSV4D_00095 [Flavobacterium sp. ARAG 55.4]|uniref:hypothetical protein n=1 Tax=Flavobacterium sp. ARAG 55.4 TaxID=3451357 RepID=UPI003F4724CA
MKAIQYIKNTGTAIIRLMYAVCTNDMIMYSRQASNIEVFVVAFFIEFNRLFIADSLFMNALQKHMFLNIKKDFKYKSNLYKTIFLENKSCFLKYLNSISFSKLKKNTVF